MTVTAACNFHGVFSQFAATLKLKRSLRKSIVFSLSTSDVKINKSSRFPDAVVQRIQHVLSLDPALPLFLVQPGRAGK
jgi:hypothetical protein